MIGTSDNLTKHRLPKSSLRELELRIERGLETFVDVGEALMEIKERKLYKESHTSFDTYCRERWGFGSNFANKQIRASKVGTIVPTFNEAQARALAPLVKQSPEEAVEVWQELKSEHGENITAAHIREAIAPRVRRPHVANNSGENEWYTPPEYIEAARKVLGSIDTDPASSPIANQTVKATGFYTIADNGLKQKWQGNVWLNPPYAQPAISDFCKTLVKKYSEGEISAAIVLINNATETSWFQQLVTIAKVICFPSGRIRFLNPDKSNPGAPLQGQAVIGIGVATEVFSQAFAGVGFIAHVY